MSSAPGPPLVPFDLTGPLPSGTTVLEASAGTGKTHTIAALATRYVAEGVADLSELLVVTFGRAATSELRDRVRTTLLRTQQGLRDPAVAARSTDPVVRLLASGTPRETDVHASRLGRALAQFDEATVTTTHGFCQQMLASLGILGDVDADSTFVPDIADVERDVVDDLYLRAYATSPNPALGVDQARTLAHVAISDHQATLAPHRAEPDSAAWHRLELARAAREELRRRKRTRRLLDYDDLLVLLRDAVAHPVHGPAALRRLRDTFRIALVDEFQDTDPVQWEIIRRAFHGVATLVLIGDPKQAIYKFRGADVVTYLQARRQADRAATLATNWRSDAALLDGLGHVLRGAALGDDDIVVRPIGAAHQTSRISGVPPVRLRQVTRTALGLAPSGGPAPVDAVRQLIASDVAADVVRLLDGPARLADGNGWRAVRPGDVAIICRRNEDATAVRAALHACGLPAVQSALVSVYGTVAARQWLTLLVALEQPWLSGRASAAALTPFLGWDAARLGTAGDGEREALSELLDAWSHALASRGVAGLFEAVQAAGLAERLMRRSQGERSLVDLRHVAEGLHTAATEGRLGTTGLIEWLRERVDGAAEDYDDTRSRRLETDVEAVQVMTVHASKGLQFPVVYVPFAWDRALPKAPEILTYHADDGTRVLDVGGRDVPDHPERHRRHEAEESGEHLRLLYVALTRARSHVVLWWAPSRNSAHGPLTRMVFGDHARGEEPPPQAGGWQRDADARARLAGLAAASGGSVVAEPVTSAPRPVRWSPVREGRPRLSVARLDRHVDHEWRRTSYSRITAAAHAEPPVAGVRTEPEAAGVEDEADVVLGAPAAGAGPETGADELPLPSPMGDLPGGTGFGTLVHRVLERVDTAVPDLDAEVRAQCARALASRTDVAVDALAGPLSLVLRTPLGPLADGATLQQVRPSDRLAELEFELPLAGGDTASNDAATIERIAALLGRHLAPDDPFHRYPERLGAAAVGSERLRGYLTGSLDAVLRLRRDGAPRYVVVDYKSNRLAPAGVPLTTWHYRPAALVEAMTAAHYPLQLLLYSVALHRFLRWRQPGYDPDHHLGGGLYLFVRGMAGPQTPRVDGWVCGVLGWRPPTPLVLELSALLDGRRA
jgi:exodeoxyribonuclease V beta subunit